MSRLTPQTLRFEALEDRATPAVTFQFDYTYDTSGFFNDPARRAVLEQVGRDIGSHLTSDPAAIVPGGGNSWTASFFNPSTGGQAQVSDPTVPEGTLKVFVGARKLTGAEAAQGGYGGYGWSGSDAWGNLVATRGEGFAVWGGSLAFDTAQTWYTGSTPPPTGQTDMYTVASHELGHLLGIGTAPAFHQLTVGGKFVGANAEAVYGGPVPVTADGAHFGSGLVIDGQPESLQPFLVTGQRYGLSALDYGALADLGWQVASIAPPTTALAGAGGATAVNPAVTTTGGSNDSTTPQSPTATPTPTTGTTGAPPAHQVDPVLPKCNCGACRGCVAVSGAGGTLQLYSFSQAGTATPLGDVIQAFPGFTGTVRAVTADVNGDGTPDVIAVTGPGGGSQVRVIDGKTGTDLLDPTPVYEATFTGGLYVAAADLDHDGRAEVIVSPDQGGGGRVTVLKIADNSAQVVANFFGIDDPNFRGGARVAAADVNGDGTPDIVVGAGYGGGPRVAVFDGAAVAAGTPRKLVNDFYAFGGSDAATLRNGVYVAAGDLNGDGKADLVFGGGPGGSPRVLVLDGAAVAADPAAAAAAPLANFFAGDPSQRGGARVAVKDVSTTGGTADLLVGSGVDTTAQVNVYAGGWGGGTPTAVTTAAPFGSSSPADGVYVG